MSEFTFSPSEFLPYLNDKEALDKVRKIKKEDICKHPNPDVKIKLIPLVSSG